MAKSELDAIVNHASTEPVELPRLTTADTFIQYHRMGTNLHSATEAFKKLPDCNSVGAANDYLKEIIRYCEGVIRSAQRLTEANR